MITKANYESYFVDYLEGNLPENQIDQFLDFLNQNPDLKKELHLFEEVSLLPEPVVFEQKKQLYKSMDEEAHRLENKMIASVEGELDSEQKRMFEDYLSANPELQKEYTLYAKTRLTPDLSVTFNNKRKLYRKPARTIALKWVARAAAMVALIWAIGSVVPTSTKNNRLTNPMTVAETSSKAVSVSTPAQTDGQKQVAEISTKSLTQTPSNTTKGTTLNVKQTDRRKIAEAGKARQTDENNQIAALTPIRATLVSNEDMQLAINKQPNPLKINDPDHLDGVEEFLASHVKKAGKEGLSSIQRIARLGLSVASELSGERIGYTEKDGKITSVEFESKLMAFSIPLEKK